VLKTVLIADDSTSMRLLSEGCCKAGIENSWFARPLTAKKSKPDLILLGLAMPWLNGAEAAPILKNAMPQTPVILFTMNTDLHAENLSAAIGIEFISKVDGIPKLLERVDALLPPSLPNEGVSLC